MPTYKESLALYDKLVSNCPRFERKGKTMPFTSANGYMFSQLNKDGELGIRFSDKIQEKYLKSLKTTPFKAYGAAMKGYVLIPESMWKDMKKLTKLLNESYDYVMSFEAK
jgi:hypothetical protein